MASNYASHLRDEHPSAFDRRDQLDLSVASIRLTALTTRIRGPLHILILKIIGSDHPGGTFAVSGGGHLVGNQAAHGRFAHLKGLGRFLQGDLAALSTLTPR